MKDQLNLFTDFNPIPELIKRGALFFSNHSGGKDSQAMFAYLRTIVPEKQLIVLHSHLPGVEWEGTMDHIQKYLHGHRFQVAQAKKTFFEMVEHRQMFPSPKNRQCTSDLKRGPLEKRIRKTSKDAKNPLIVNCMGMRVQELSKRAKLIPFKFSAINATKKPSCID
jgi:DNA sulfur modification protein DndC